MGRHAEWSNGKVGLCGISYYAINQWLVAAIRPPHLAAILPWEGASDHYRDMSYHGGILSNGFFGRWYPRQVLPVQHGRGTEGPRSRWVSDGLATGPQTLPDAELRRCAPTTWTTCAGTGSTTAGTPSAALTWAGSRCRCCRRRTGAGSGCTAAATSRASPGPARPPEWLAVHTGRHEELFYTAHGVDLQRRFFDHFLKGADNGWDTEPPCSSRSGTPTAPSGRAASRPGRCRAPSGRAGTWTPTRNACSGPRPAADRGQHAFDGRGDGVTFTSAPLPAPLELTGPLLANLQVSADSDDADLFVTLRAFAPDGEEVTFCGANDPRAPLSQGWLRLSHRAVDPARSLPWRPWHPHQAVEPARRPRLPRGRRAVAHLRGPSGRRPAGPVRGRA